MIGKTVWLFDSNRRVYPAGGGQCIFREFFRPVQIVGETRLSWKVNYQGERLINKRTWRTKPGYGVHAVVYQTQQDVDDEVFIHDNRQRIREAFIECRDVDAVRTIARILGVVTE